MVVLTRFGHKLYGSTIDWNTQHYSLPEYFRMRFYDTGQLFPNFAMNLGAGQNIYNFSYYGLFSPYIWFAYLLPFVSMRTYIIVTSALIVDVSIFLIYKWLKNRYSTKVSAVSTFFFAMSAPILFHSHRHIMFMNYMPFLILALMGVDKYFEKKKKGLLIISACMMVFTSYFFSVGGMFAIGIYSIYCYLERNEKFVFKDCCRKIGKIVMYLMISIMMSAVLILPTFATLTKGRCQTNTSVSIKDLIIPKLNYDFVLYKNYSMGLTVIFIMALVYVLYEKKKQDRFLGIIFASIIIFPVFIYILNATMYIESKVLIPFIPLAIIIIAQYFCELLEKKQYDKKKLLIIQAIVAVVSIIFTLAKSDFIKIFVIDMAITMVAMVVAHFLKRQKIVIVTSMLIALVTCLVGNFMETYDANDKLRDEINADIKKATDYVASLEKDTLNRTFIDSNRKYNFNSIYNIKTYSTGMYSSVGDMGYNDFYFQKFGVENPHRNSAIMSWGKNLMFNTYMSNKYFISNECKMNGYKEKKRFSDYVCVYENENVCPIGYASSNVMSKKQFDKIEYPYSNEALLKYIVVDKDLDDVDFKNDIKEYKDFSLEKQDDMIEANKLKKINGYRIKVSPRKDKDYKLAEDIFSNVKLKFKDELKNKLLIIRFDIDNTIAKYSYKKSEGDVIIKIDNDIINKITTPTWKYYNNNEVFEYVLSDKSYKECNLNLGYGEYNISNFKMYTYDYDKLKDVKKDLDEFVISDIIKDTIQGNIDVKNDGYFKLSIPYDDGFKIEVDGDETSYEKVDDTFIGFPIKKGEHKINITFTAKYSFSGKIL